jgi:hypothetical protein
VGRGSPARERACEACPSLFVINFFVAAAQAMPLLRHGPSTAAPLPNRCCFAVPLPHHCHATAVPLPHYCHATAVPLPYHCRAAAVPLPCHCRTASDQCLCSRRAAAAPCLPLLPCCAVPALVLQDARGTIAYMRRTQNFMSSRGLKEGVASPSAAAMSFHDDDAEEKLQAPVGPDHQAPQVGLVAVLTLRQWLTCLPAHMSAWSRHRARCCAVIAVGVGGLWCALCLQLRKQASAKRALDSSFARPRVAAITVAAVALPAAPQASVPSSAPATAALARHSAGAALGGGVHGSSGGGSGGGGSGGGGSLSGSAGGSGSGGSANGQARRLSGPPASSSAPTGTLAAPARRVPASAPYVPSSTVANRLFVGAAVKPHATGPSGAGSPVPSSTSSAGALSTKSGIPRFTKAVQGGSGGTQGGASAVSGAIQPQPYAASVMRKAAAAGQRPAVRSGAVPPTQGSSTGSPSTGGGALAAAFKGASLQQQLQQQQKQPLRRAVHLPGAAVVASSSSGAAGAPSPRHEQRLAAVAAAAATSAPPVLPPQAPPRVPRLSSGSAASASAPAPVSAPPPQAESAVRSPQFGAASASTSASASALASVAVAAPVAAPVAVPGASAAPTGRLPSPAETATDSLAHDDSTEDAELDDDGFYVGRRGSSALDGVALDLELGDPPGTGADAGPLGSPTGSPSPDDAGDTEAVAPGWAADDGSVATSRYDSEAEEGLAEATEVPVHRDHNGGDRSSEGSDGPDLFEQYAEGSDVDFSDEDLVLPEN